VANVLYSLAALPHWHSGEEDGGSEGAAPSPPPSDAAAWGAYVPRAALRPAVRPAHVAALRGELLGRLLAAERQGGSRGGGGGGAALSAQGICTSLWALAALGACTAEVWHAGLAALAALEQGGCGDQLEGYAQLHDAALLLRAAAGGGEPAGCAGHARRGPAQEPRLPQALAQRAQRAARSVRDQGGPSRLQREVAAALAAAGVQAEAEWAVEVSGRQASLCGAAARLLPPSTAMTLAGALPSLPACLCKAGEQGLVGQRRLLPPPPSPASAACASPAPQLNVASLAAGPARLAGVGTLRRPGASG
jgi:hypothetical protein